MFFRRLAIGVGALLLSVSLAGATGWFVRVDGSDMNCNGAFNRGFPTLSTLSERRDCAFQSVQRAASIAGCGDVVFVGAGTHTIAGGTGTITGVPGGNYNYTSFAKISGKACTAANPLMFIGLRVISDPPMPDTEANYFTILDGAGTTNIAWDVKSSSFVVISGFLLKNLRGNSDNYDSSIAIGVLDIQNSSDITYEHNRHNNPNADAGEDSGAELFISNAPRVTVFANYVETGHPQVMAMGGPWTPPSYTLNNSIVRENVFIKLRHQRLDGVLWTEQFWMNLKKMNTYTVRSNYFGRGPAFNTPTSKNAYAIQMRESINGEVLGNVFDDIKAGVGAWVRIQESLTGSKTCCGSGYGGESICPGASCCHTTGAGDMVGDECNEKHRFTNNTFYKRTPGIQATFFGLANCNGVQLYNNLFAVAPGAEAGGSGDRALAIGCNGLDFAGVQNARVNYSGFSNIQQPTSGPGSNWGCPTAGSCPGQILTNDVLVSANDRSDADGVCTGNVGCAPNPGLIDGSQNKPVPYFEPAGGSWITNQGSNDFCHVAPADGVCDIGAFEATTGTPDQPGAGGVRNPTPRVVVDPNEPVP